MQAQGPWKQDRGADKYFSYLNLRQSSCLAGLTLISLLSAAILRVSDIQQHFCNEHRSRECFKKINTFKVLFATLFLITGSADADKFFYVRSSFIYQIQQPGLNPAVNVPRNLLLQSRTDSSAASEQCPAPHSTLSQKN